MELDRVLPQHTNWVYSVAISPDGYLLASTGDDHVARVYSLHSHEQVSSVVLPNAGRVVMFLDDARIVVGCNHGDVLLCGVDGTVLRELRRHGQATYGAVV